MTAGPIMIMAGGTGGHVFPGLAVAEVLLERRRPVVWLGTHLGLEATVVPEHGIDIEWITISGIRRRGIVAWLVAPFRIARAIVQVLGTLKRRRPSAVLGMGGFVSGPGGIAAWLARRPLLIHEQNAIAGTTNRLLARFATRVFEAFPGSFATHVRVECIGNPVRRVFRRIPPPRERGVGAADRRMRLFVLGGSQGARALNERLPRSVALIAPDRRPEIRHQAGRGLDETVMAYREAGVEARVDGFIDDIAEAYAWADLVVARAGALTIAELSACGVGAILVPLPRAADDHQTLNARSFTANGAGRWIPQSELGSERLAAELERLLGDREELTRMAERAREQAHAGAAERLAGACEAASGGPA